MGEGGGVAVLVILYSVQRGGAGCYSVVVGGGYIDNDTWTVRKLRVVLWGV